MASPQSRHETHRPGGRTVPSQRRAGRACLSCRARKVKCDVLQHGTPCQNCRINEVDCLIARCRRGKKPNAKASKSNRALWKDVPAESFFHSEHSETISPVDSHSKISEHSYQRNPSPFILHNNAAAILNPMVSLGDLPTGLERLRSSAAARSPVSEAGAQKELPAFFKPLNNCTPLDLEYLHRKGALKIPQVPLRLEIIRCYIEYLHPYMPMLDVEELLRTFDPTIDPPIQQRYSFLLFQCIMFAAVAFVEESLVEETEQKSLKAVRKTFYQKARILYDADIESDNLTLIRCLLLMSQWAENTDTTKQNWHWTGIATSLAQAMRLTNNPDGLKLPQRAKSLRKRLWWCCFMRDRLLSLGMSRPMRIREGDFDVPLPTVDDFECDILGVAYLRTNEYRTDARMRTSLFDKSTSTKLAQIFISNVKLCVSIGSIFSVQYTTFMRASQPFDDAPSNPSANIMLYPISNQSSDRAFVQMRDSTFSLLDKDLTEWFRALPEFTHLSELRSQPDPPLGYLRQDGSENVRHRTTSTSFGSDNVPQPASVALQAAILHMSYYATSSALHRPKNRSPLSAQKVMEAAEGMASICAFLNENRLIKYLPVNTITMLLASIIWHMLFLKSMCSTDGSGQCGATEESESQRARDNVSELLASLQALRKAHVGADFVTTLVNGFLTRIRSRIIPCPSDTCARSQTSKGREFEIQLDCDRADQIVPLSGKRIAADEGPPTPQSQVMETAPGIISSSQTSVVDAFSQDTTRRSEDCFAFTYGVDLDGYETGESTLNSILGFPDFDSNIIAEAWHGNGPSMSLWDDGIASLNELTFALDWLA